MEYQAFLRAAANVRPSPRQLAMLDNPYYAFVHFTVNTYTGREWGDGTEDPAIFNPVNLDCDQWVAAIKSAGMTGLVLTAKHHDGFCLWPSRYTEHSVKNSPYKNGKGDIVREAAEACRRGGIRFGFYLSPWDRNHPDYGTPAYNDYYKAQLTELLTNYGEIFHVWFDGACGEGPSGRRQEYDFEGFFDLVRRYQPGATIFQDAGPDIRWIGNEAGKPRASEWAVVPCELTRYAKKQTEGPLLPGDLTGIYNTNEQLGELSTIQYARGLCFCPSEVDMSIRKGWFYHPEEEPHSVERLFHTYISSVGNNATFNLNVPPMPDGRFDPRDVKRLAELGDALRAAFGKPVVAQTLREEISDTQCIYHVRVPAGMQVKYVLLEEDIAQGQRVERFMLTRTNFDGRWNVLFDGTTIGRRRICEMKGETEDFDVRILCARDRVENLRVTLF